MGILSVFVRISWLILVIIKGRTLRAFILFAGQQQGYPASGPQKLFVLSQKLFFGGTQSNPWWVTREKKAGLLLKKNWTQHIPVVVTETLVLSD